nr:odorant binding protein 13 [Pachyrhinus yasumatsui]
MRNLFVFLSCVFMFVDALDQALVAELVEKIQEVGIECAEQEKTPQADIEALMNKEAPKTHEGKCTIFCVLKKINIMKDATTLGAGYTPWLEKAQVDDPDFYSKLMKLYKICGSKVKENEDGCENAFALAACSKDEGIKQVAGRPVTRPKECIPACPQHNNLYSELPNTRGLLSAL